MLQKRFFLEPEFEDEAVFDLLAIHSPAEDFFLAYKLNEVLNSLLIKVIEEKDNDATHSTTSFNRFVWEQNSGDFVLELIANHFFYHRPIYMIYKAHLDYLVQRPLGYCVIIVEYLQP